MQGYTLKFVEISKHDYSAGERFKKRVIIDFLIIYKIWLDQMNNLITRFLSNLGQWHETALTTTKLKMIYVTGTKGIPKKNNIVLSPA